MQNYRLEKLEEDTVMIENEKTVVISHTTTYRKTRCDDNGRYSLDGD